MRYKLMERRIKSLCQDKASGQKTSEEFQRGIAHNIRWISVNRIEENDATSDAE